MNVTGRVCILAIALLIVAAVGANAAQWRQVAAAQSTAHHTHADQSHQHVDGQSATHHCQDATGPCCCNAMTCCVVLQPISMPDATTVSHDFTMLTPQPVTSLLFVPRLPPRAA